MKIIHISSAHNRYDSRIFRKECRSLAKSGFNVILIVADGLPDEVADGVIIRSIKRAPNRISRIIYSSHNLFQVVMKIDADFYHIHDPELLPLGLRLKHRGKRVVFDSHEDVPRQLLTKPYLPKYLLRFISFCYSVFERYAFKRLNCLVTVTETIYRRLSNVNSNTFLVRNYPVIEARLAVSDYEKRELLIAYIGSISEIRGIWEMLDALSIVKTNTKLLLAGSWSPPRLLLDVRSSPGWNNIEFRGELDNANINLLLDQVRIGLVLLHPTPSYMDSLPIKLFEYMAAGIPVIASNFPLWKEIVVTNNCGLCVDPLKPDMIANAIDWMIANPSLAEEMGENGRLAVEKQYNWSSEIGVLESIYKAIGK